MARPTKYEPWMPAKVIEVMAQGGSKLEAACEIGISEETFYVWTKDNPEFSEAVKEGEVASRTWWEKLGRKASAGEVQNFNATAWIFNMKNRAGWTDKQETKHTGNVTLQLSTLDEQL